MRAPFLLLPVALALSAPLHAAAADDAKVLFCSGDCYAVDAAGVRTPAPKGTQLLPGQRLETGPGSYAQVKLGSGNAFGVGANARVKLERDGIFLDEGRIRVVGSQAARPVEVRTDDSTFVLRSADIELKKSGATGPASPLLVKLNAGEARVSGDALTNGGVQLVTAGSVIPGAPLPGSEMAPEATRTAGPVAQAGRSASVVTLPVALTPVALKQPISLPPPVVKGPIFAKPPTLILPPNMKSVPPPVVALPPKPVLPGGKGEVLLYRPVLNTTTGEILTLNTAIIKTVDPTYVSPTSTLLTTKVLSPTTVTTSTIDSTVLTTTKLPTTTTTTTTTTSTLKLLSPSLTTFSIR